MTTPTPDIGMHQTAQEIQRLQWLEQLDGTLRGAANIIKKQGLAKGEIMDSSGQVCAIGSLILANASDEFLAECLNGKADVTDAEYSGIYPVEPEILATLALHIDHQSAQSALDDYAADTVVDYSDLLHAGIMC